MIVEASLSHPESVNRTKLDCTENGLPSVCMDLTLCFSYKGKEVPGYISKCAPPSSRLTGVDSRSLTWKSTVGPHCLCHEI